MMFERLAGSRGEVSAGWLHSRHTFSFGHFHDPQWMGFGPLRVINEDIVAPGGGFPPHRHANMEILSVVLSGALAHKDNTGGEGVLRPGEVQWMSAGHGVEHSEFNGAKDAPVHFLQIWIQPDRLNAPPAYEQRAFDVAEREGRWQTLAAPDGADGGLPLRQQAWLRAVRLAPGESVEVVLDPARKYWLHVATGDIAYDTRALTAGDALGFADEAGTHRLEGRGAEPADVLFFDLPA